MSIHVCKCIHKRITEYHLRYPGLTEKEAQYLADKINSGLLYDSDINEDKKDNSAIFHLDIAISAMKEAAIALRNITNYTTASRKAHEMEGAVEIAQSLVEVLRNRIENDKHTRAK